MIPLTLLTALPWGKIGRVVGAVVLTLVVLYLPYHYGCTTTAAGYKEQIAGMQRDAATLTLKAEQVQRTEEQRRQTVIEEVSKDADDQIAVANGAARGAHAAVVGLRDAYIAYAASHAGPHAGTPPGGQTAAGADVSADVLSSAATAAADYAAIADRARIAGAACERAYDSVRQP